MVFDVNRILLTFSPSKYNFHREIKFPSLSDLRESNTEQMAFSLFQISIPEIKMEI
jgi:hypothetical protein